MGPTAYLHSFEVMYTNAKATSVGRDVAFIGLLFIRASYGEVRGITAHTSDYKNVKFEPRVDITGHYGESKKVSYESKALVGGRKVEMTFTLDLAKQVCTRFCLLYEAGAYGRLTVNVSCALLNCHR